MFNKDNGFVHFFKAFGYSLAGFKAAWVNETAFRQEVILCSILFPLAIGLGHTGVEKALLISGLILILLTELVNSAIEAVADRFGQEVHPLIQQAKDLGSAAVFVALCYTALVWGLVLFF